MTCIHIFMPTHETFPVIQKLNSDPQESHTEGEERILAIASQSETKVLYNIPRLFDF
jgi:hypothetical protein